MSNKASTKKTRGVAQLECNVITAALMRDPSRHALLRCPPARTAVVSNRLKQSPFAGRTSTSASPACLKATRISSFPSSNIKQTHKRRQHEATAIDGT